MLVFQYPTIDTAFQIVDDVLNLHGFKVHLKTRGEDLMHGKITFPVVKASRYLSKKEYLALINKIMSKPTRRCDIDAIIKILEDCGAIQESIKQAEHMIEKSWGKLDPLLEDSLHKIMLYIFGKFVIDRVY